MKQHVRLRFLGLIAAMLLMGLGVAFLTVKSQWQSSEVRTKLRRIDSEGFQVADKFKHSLRELNELLFHYGRSHMAPDVAAFTQASDELNLWINEQKPKLTSLQEKASLEQIDTAYDDYLRVARQLLTRLQAIGEASATVDEYVVLRKETQRLSDLGEKLSRAHLDSRDQILAEVNSAFTTLRVLVLIALGLLFVFALSLGFAVYRDMILPLRLKLVESESLRERQEKLVSLGVLAAGVAHEIRNPLTAIKAALYLQQRRHQPGTQEASDGKIIDREILRLERIVNDFLLFARPGDSKLAPINADVPMREVHTLLQPQLAKAGIQLTLGELRPLPIHADEEQLKQVLINLVRNAAEAIEKNGVVQMRVRMERKRLNRQEVNTAVLEVEDNGRGIPADVQKRLFDPFFTTKETGTGLGLSIASRIVQSHGGVLEYQTTPGYGSTFGVVLPSSGASATPNAIRHS